VVVVVVVVAVVDEFEAGQRMMARKIGIAFLTLIFGALAKEEEEEEESVRFFSDQSRIWRFGKSFLTEKINGSTASDLFACMRASSFADNNLSPCLPACLPACLHARNFHLAGFGNVHAVYVCKTFRKGSVQKSLWG
jgi:hypothetical protein